MVKKLLKVLIVLICLIVQLFVGYLLYLATINKIHFVKIIYSFFCLYIILKIIKDSKSYSYILPWILIFMVVPIPGSIIYLTIKLNLKLNKFLNSVKKEEKESKKYLVNEGINNKIEDNSLARYINNYVKFPVTTNNDVKYFPLGDYALDTMLEELNKAEKFIFFEYFIVNYGKMWDSILEILEKKVKEGVEVRVMYDDLGCLTTLDKNYYRELRKKGIKCEPFNRLKVFGGVVI